MSDVLDRLEASLRPDDAPDTPTEGWTVTNLHEAAWASRKAAAAHRKIAEVKAWGEREKARIDAVVAAEAKRHEDDAAFFEYHLGAYLQAEIMAGRKTKSLTLPGGTIKLTARQPRVDVDDEAFLAWAREAGRVDLVRVKESVDKTALKKALVLEETDEGRVAIDPTTGAIVEGVTWEAQGDSVTFTATDEEEQ